MANRWGNNGNSDIPYFLGLQNHCRWWLQAMKLKDACSLEEKQPRQYMKRQRHSVQFSRSVMSDSLWPHEPQHARPPCLSPTPGVHPNPCPLSWWCHPTILSSVVPFSSCPLSFPGSGSFQMSQLFTSGGLGVSASTSLFAMNTQDWSPGLVGSPCSPRDSQESSPTPQFRSINSSALSFLFSPTLTSIHDQCKNHSLD